MGKIKLYIVEDEIIIANDLKNNLTDLGYDVLGIDGKGERPLNRSIFLPFRTYYRISS